MTDKRGIPPISQRFRGFLPVVIDLETGGFNSRTDALLEIAAVLVDFNDQGLLAPEECFRFHVEPFEGANIEPASLEVTGIDPHHPLRPAIPEKEALQRIFREVRKKLREVNCKRAVLVAHNAHFDLGFLNAAIERTAIKRSPFHPFSVFDTATLGGIAYGQTVLARMAEAAGMQWDNGSAHSAAYDAEQTAEIFCQIVNSFKPVYDARKTVDDGGEDTEAP
jgi:ribonuclease T